MKLKSIIVDDEKHGRENLAGILQDYCPQVELLGEAASVEAALSLIREHSPDLVFLDIEMPRANGFQLLEHLQDFSFEVIFVTAYDNYAIKAIRFSAADYILKPININILQAAVQNVLERFRQKQENQRMKQLYHNLSQPGNPRIGLPTSDRIEYAEVGQIIRCQGEGNYTHIYFEGEKHLLISKSRRLHQLGVNAMGLYAYTGKIEKDANGFPKIDMNTRVFSKNDIIDEYGGERLSDSQFDVRYADPNDFETASYAIKGLGNVIFDGLAAATALSYSNESIDVEKLMKKYPKQADFEYHYRQIASKDSKANAKLKDSVRAPRMVAARNIYKGQEILWNYGAEYWSSRGMKIFLTKGGWS